MYSLIDTFSLAFYNKVKYIHEQITAENLGHVAAKFFCVNNKNNLFLSVPSHNFTRAQTHREYAV